MKFVKYLKFLCLVMIVIPINVFALNQISGISIDAPSEAEVGKEIPVTFKIRVSNLDKNDINSKGIAAIAFGFSASDDLLAVDYESDWYTEAGKEGNEYVVVSAIKEGLSNTCIDGVLFCGEYQITFNFYIKSNSSDYATIKFDEIAVGLYPVSYEELNEDDIELLELEPDTSYKIKIIDNSVTPPANVPSSTIEDAPAPDITDSIKIPTITKPTNKPSSNTIKKSDNNAIKALEVKGYDFKFYKDKLHYSILIPKDVNSINLNVELEDDKASYKVIGADDLKKNNYQIKIEVTAENEERQVYTIDAIVQRKKKEEPKMVKVFGKNINQKYIIYGGIAALVIVGLIIIKVVFKAIKNNVDNRKINKALKEIDKNK